ncbi:MAG: hypothetical protein MUP24_12025 [Gillisia sp.]|nr:hypothetical protein [Gillisia sp.]
MRTFGPFLDNYNRTTEGLNIFFKIIVIFVLALIILTVIGAFVNVILAF